MRHRASAAFDRWQVHAQVPKIKSEPQDALYPEFQSEYDVRARP